LGDDIGAQLVERDFLIGSPAGPHRHDKQGVGFESLEDGRASQRKLASLSFDAAGFGHGKHIAKDASTRFRNKWLLERLLDWGRPLALKMALVMSSGV